MWKWICSIGIFWLWSACSSDKTIEIPESVKAELQMATVGSSNFEDYIHHLTVLAFRRTAAGTYVYRNTLAELGSAEITGLPDASSRGDAKLMPVTLPAGTYQLYFIGNGAGKWTAALKEGVTEPQDIFLARLGEGQDSIWFLGHLNVKLSASYISPLKVTLNRAVSKLVVLLDGVPAETENIGIRIENIAEQVDLNGTPGGQPQVIEKNYAVSLAKRDSVIYELLLLPTLGSRSPWQLSFQMKNGQRKVKDMPYLQLFPDKYVRITGKIADTPGGLLDLQFKLSLSIFDYFEEKSLPDFSLTPVEP